MDKENILCASMTETISSSVSDDYVAHPINLLLIRCSCLAALHLFWLWMKMGGLTTVRWRSESFSPECCCVQFTKLIKQRKAIDSLPAITAILNQDGVWLMARCHKIHCFYSPCSFFICLPLTQVHLNVCRKGQSKACILINHLTLHLPHVRQQFCRFIVIRWEFLTPDLL